MTNFLFTNLIYINVTKLMLVISTNEKEFMKQEKAQKVSILIIRFLNRPPPTQYFKTKLKKQFRLRILYIV